MLGGNVFGWTAHEAESFDSSTPTPRRAATSSTRRTCTRRGRGERGASRRRSSGGGWPAREPSLIIVATKVGQAPALPGLAPAYGSRGRGGVAPAPRDRPHRPLLRAHRRRDDAAGRDARGVRRAVREGKVRHIAASNYTAPRLAEALAISKREGLARYEALQNHYNLVRSRRLRGRAAGRLRTRKPRVCAVLRAGERVPDREVPARSY